MEPLERLLMNKKALITGITGQDGLYLAEGDLTDQSSQSFVGTSWNQPVLTGDVTGMGAGNATE